MYGIVAVVTGPELVVARILQPYNIDREQYTRSNAATARLLTLVKPAET